MRRGLCFAFSEGKNVPSKAAAAEQFTVVLVPCRMSVQRFMKWQCAVDRQCVGAFADGEIEKKNYSDLCERREGKKPKNPLAASKRNFLTLSKELNCGRLMATHIELLFWCVYEDHHHGKFHPVKMPYAIGCLTVGFCNVKISHQKRVRSAIVQSQQVLLVSVIIKLIVVKVSRLGTRL